MTSQLPWHLESHKFIHAHVYISCGKLATHMLCLTFQNEVLSSPSNRFCLQLRRWAWPVRGRSDDSSAVAPVSVGFPSPGTLMMPKSTEQSRHLLQNVAQKDKPQPTSPCRFPVHMTTSRPPDSPVTLSGVMGRIGFCWKVTLRLRASLRLTLIPQRAKRGWKFPKSKQPWLLYLWVVQSWISQGLVLSQALKLLFLINYAGGEPLQILYLEKAAFSAPTCK